MFAFIIIETIMYYICICITLHYVRNYIFKKKLWLLIIPVLYSILTVLNYLITKDTTNFISFFIIFLIDFTTNDQGNFIDYYKIVIFQ